MIQTLENAFDKWNSILLENLTTVKSKTKLLSIFRINKQLKRTIKTVSLLEKSKYIPLSFLAKFEEKNYTNENKDIKELIKEAGLSNGLDHFLHLGFEDVLEGKRKIKNLSNLFSAKCGPRAGRLMQFKEFLKEIYLDKNKKQKINSDANLKKNTQITHRSTPKSLSTINDQEEPDIDIILPVYNALKDVQSCIKSLYDNRTLLFNLIVVDDHSDNETKIWLEQEQLKRGYKLLRNQSNLRFTKSVNKGFQNSTSAFIVLLNSDTVVTRYWIEKILRCFKHDRSTGIVGPLSNAASWQTIPHREDKKKGGWLVNEIPQDFSVELMGELVECLSTNIYPLVPSVNGFCYALRREVLEKVGELDEGYFPTGYGEEDDLSIRASKAGFSIRVADDTYIYHAKSKSYTSEVRKVLTIGGRKSLDKKYGKSKIDQLISQWKSEPNLPQIGLKIDRFMHRSKGNKKVLYTAIFGEYDTLKDPEYINSDWDYVCYTNNPRLTSKVYIIKVVPEIHNNGRKSARMIKVLSHLFLIGYDYSLWVDGSVKLRGKNVDELVDSLSSDDNYILIHKHVKRDCLYLEKDACIKANKDSADTLDKQINYYKAQGMPEGGGLFESAQILRKQLDHNTHKLNSEWWKQIDQFSVRDQVSLPFVMWKFDFKYKAMTGSQWLDPYFHIYNHQNKVLGEQGTEKIEIIVRAGDNSSQISSTIDNIKKNTNYKDYAITVIVKNNSIDSKKFSKIQNSKSQVVRVVALEGNNINSYINKLISESRNETFCILESNIIIFNSDWLSMLIAGLKINKKVTAVGPTVLNEDYKFIASGIRFKKAGGRIIKFYNSRKLGATGKVDALHECCIMLNKSNFIRVGGFNETIEGWRNTIIEYCHRNTRYKRENYLILNAELICSNDDDTQSGNDELVDVLNKKQK